MELIKKERLNQLFDLYSNLLTKYQIEVFEMYYYDDLSLNEISEYYKVSRNAIFNLLKRVETILEDYETKLGLLKKYNQIIKICEENKNAITNKIIQIIED